MRAIAKYAWPANNREDWILNLAYLPNLHNGSFASSTSGGSINLYLLQQLSNSPILRIDKAHESSINSMKAIDDTTIGSCSTDGLKIWDLRTSSGKPVHTLANAKTSNFLSLDYFNNLLAGGTELVGADAELHIWDLRNTSNVVRSFIDSHNDDITDIKFHPNSRFLMSGSTDGCVNVYDLEQEDEEDALHQVINYASVHSCNFIQDNRISVLSHMETLAFYELNNTNYEKIEEPAPSDIGDVRKLWPDCEYVVDIYPSGYVACGANSQLKLALHPFNPVLEKVDLSKPVWFPDAHGAEVVRDVLVIPNQKSALTCGEDGTIKAWELPYELQYFDLNLNDTKSEMKEDVLMGTEEPNSELKPLKKEKKDKKDKKEKKEKKEKKDKSDRKSKRDKKDKDGKSDRSKKKKSDVRFKPY